jgi:hypothetical protein
VLPNANAFNDNARIVLDVLLLVVFYIIRIYYGAVIIDVTVSSYLYLTIMSAAFYLSLGKRRCELEYSSESRKVLKIYTKEYLSRFMDICLTVSVGRGYRGVRTVRSPTRSHYGSNDQVTLRGRDDKKGTVLNDEKRFRLPVVSAFWFRYRTYMV